MAIGGLLAWWVPRSAFGDAPTDRTRAKPPASARTGAAMPNEPILNAKFIQTEAKLIVEYAVQNGDQPVLLLNRLMHLGSPLTADDQKAYRFVVGNNLRLLLGQAPLPDFREVHAKNVPQLVRLNAHQYYKESFVLERPVTEYSCYSAFEPRLVADAAVQDVTLFAEYVEAHAVRVRASTLFPNAFEAESSIARDRIHRLSSTVEPLTIPVRKFADDFPRLRLPGEPVALPRSRPLQF
jgi:hypothetical protein